jgi:hypothetical protein
MHKEDMDSPGGGFLAKQVAAGKKLPSLKPKRKKKTTKKRKRNTGLRY